MIVIECIYHTCFFQIHKANYNVVARSSGLGSGSGGGGGAGGGSCPPPLFLSTSVPPPMREFRSNNYQQFPTLNGAVGFK